MGKIEETLKSEILRLAKRATNDRLKALEKDNTVLKREVSRLSRTLDSLSKKVKTHEKDRLEKKLEPDLSENELQNARVSPLLIKKLRKKLGVSQQNLGRLVGVSLATIAGWEAGRTSPRDANKQSLIALRNLGRRDVKKLLDGKS